MTQRTWTQRVEQEAEEDRVYWQHIRDLEDERDFPDGGADFWYHSAALESQMEDWPETVDPEEIERWNRLYGTPIWHQDGRGQTKYDFQEYFWVQDPERGWVLVENDLPF